MFRLGITGLAVVAGLASLMSAQDSLPDAPSATMQPQAMQDHLTAAHRFRQSAPDRSRHALLADDPYVPLNKKEKFDSWIKQTYAPTTFIGVAVDTAFTAATNDFRYCCGAEAWGMQYGAALADTEARRFFGRFLFPVITGQDPRYLPKRRGSIPARMWYAATRVIVTRNNEGDHVFNSSELYSVAFARALSNAYYPEKDRTFGRTAARIYGTYQSDITSNLLTEFWPDIKAVFKRHAPEKLSHLPMVRLALN